MKVKHYEKVAGGDINTPVNVFEKCKLKLWTVSLRPIFEKSYTEGWVYLSANQMSHKYDFPNF